MWLRVRDSTLKEGYRFVAINRRMTRAQRVQDLLEKEVPFPSAIRQVGLPAGLVEMLMQQAAQAAQQQAPAQVQNMMLQAQAAGQQVAPEQIQQIMAGLVQQAIPGLVMSAPQMQEEYTDNAVAQLEMDILIDTAPDTTIAAQEEFAEMAKLFGQHQIHMLPPPILKAMLENSNLRNKQAMIEAVTQKPDPMQQQVQQLQMQLMQSQLQNSQMQTQLVQAQAQLTAAKAQGEQADTAKTVAETQIMIPAEAQRDQAAAMKDAAEAGAKTAPTPAGSGQLTGVM
jgi:hypothetical protein